MSDTPHADICLILEGSYPYVQGGVAGWTQELIEMQKHLNFHVLSIQPVDASIEPRYDFPKNVVGHTVVRLDDLPRGTLRSGAFDKDIAAKIEERLERFDTRADLADVAEIIRLIRAVPNIGGHLLLDSKAAWEMLTRMYESEYPESSFLDYFWSWRVLMSGLFSMLLCELPPARCYHALSTGFAGLLAARARIGTSKPVLLTEHGIYTNERRIEIAAAEWLEETASKALSIDRTRLSLRDLWNHVFGNYARVAYEASGRIVTLFQGNQPAQLADGAAADRLRVIPNGIDLERFGAVARKPQAEPTIAFIGRVVPIKDVKTFLRACAALHRYLPDLRAYIVGPTDEDEEYFDDCRRMAVYLGLENTVVFTGKSRVEDYYAIADLVVLTSISEAQPLVVLEAGACGIPVVATDVGSCQELIMGRDDEYPKLGAGGAITPLANAEEIAQAMLTLLTDAERRDAAGKALQARVRTYYAKIDQYRAYRALYDEALNGGID